MKSVLVGVTWLVLAGGIASAVPARPLYEPEPPTKPPSIPSILLQGTWTGKLYNDGEQVTFHADGTLTYGDVRGPGSPGSWKLTGNQLYFEINKYSEYKVTVEGDVIHGIGWNKGGMRCTPYLKRVSKDK